MYTKLVVLDGHTENPGGLDQREMEALDDLTVYVRADHSQVEKRMQDADAVIINKAPMTRELTQKSKQFRCIGVLTAGCDVVDIEAASDLHITVTNVPGYGTDTVTQYTIVLLLEVTSRVRHHAERVEEGEWASNADWCFWDYPLMELSGRTIRIIGFGRIDREVAEIAQTLGMHVLFHDVHADNDTHAEKVSLEELPRRGDVVSLHCPLTKESDSLINRAILAVMKSNAILISSARGKLVDEYDLAQALQNGTAYTAILDVVREEPVRNDNPPLECDNCLITPHIPWASKGARYGIMDTTVEGLRCFLQGEEQNRIVQIIYAQ